MNDFGTRSVEYARTLLWRRLCARAIRALQTILIVPRDICEAYAS